MKRLVALTSRTRLRIVAEIVAIERRDQALPKGAEGPDLIEAKDGGPSIAR